MGRSRKGLEESICESVKGHGGPVNQSLMTLWEVTRKGKRNMKEILEVEEKRL